MGEGGMTEMRCAEAGVRLIFFGDTRIQRIEALKAAIPGLFAVDRWRLRLAFDRQRRIPGVPKGGGAVS
jgi:hypothetical protein